MKKTLIVLVVALVLLGCGVVSHLVLSGAVDLPNPHGAIEVLVGVC